MEDYSFGKFDHNNDYLKKYLDEMKKTQYDIWTKKNNPIYDVDDNYYETLIEKIKSAPVKSNKEKLDEIPIDEIEKYLREKKLERIKKLSK